MAELSNINSSEYQIFSFSREENFLENLRFLEEKSTLSKETLEVINSRVNSNLSRYFGALLIICNAETFEKPIVILRPNQEPEYITVQTIQDIYTPILRNLSENQKDEILKNPPEGKTPYIKEPNHVGVVTAENLNNLQESPVYGAKRNNTSLFEAMMNKIHPDFSKNLEKFYVYVKTRAYLNMPTAFQYSSKIISYIRNGLTQIFTIINDIYKGMINIIQQVYVYINSILVMVQKMMINIIEQIIPLDLICLLLETFQVLLDDLNFFTSLYGQNGPFFKYVNDFQNFINISSQFASNPFTTLSFQLPPQIRNFMDTVNQIGSDPNGFLADNLSNYGYAWALAGIQGNVLGALVNKFGPQYAAIGAVSRLLNTFENYPKGMAHITPTPAVVGININNNNGNPLDSNLNPNNLKKIEKESYFSR